MLVCEPKFHSWGRCTMALTNMHSDLRLNPFSGLYIILYYIILYYIILYYIILYYIILWSYHISITSYVIPITCICTSHNMHNHITSLHNTAHHIISDKYFTQLYLYVSLYYIYITKSYYIISCHVILS